MYNETGMYQGYSQEQMGYSQQLPRLTKGQAYEYIRECVQTTMNVPVTELVKLDCASPTIRHICLNAQDVLFLQQSSVGVPIGGTIAQVPVWFCPLCGKLYVNPDYLSTSGEVYY